MLLIITKEDGKLVIKVRKVLNKWGLESDEIRSDIERSKQQLTEHSIYENKIRNAAKMDATLRTGDHIAVIGPTYPTGSEHKKMCEEPIYWEDQDIDPTIQLTRQFGKFAQFIIGFLLIMIIIYGITQVII